MKQYEIRKEVEFGCTIYSIVNKETGVRINYYAKLEDAQAFIARQIHARNFDLGAFYLSDGTSYQPTKENATEWK